MDGCLLAVRKNKAYLYLEKNDRAVRKTCSQQFSKGISLAAVISGSGTELRKVLLMERFLLTATVKHYADDVLLLNS